MNSTSLSRLLPEPAVYFPVIDGLYSTRAGLSKFGTDFGNGQQDKHLFQLDKQFLHYRENKIDAQEKSVHDYVCTDEATGSQLAAVNQFILRQLCKEHPEYFSLNNSKLECQLTNETLQTNDENLFDLLALQIQEDICIMHIGESSTRLIAAHLCAANHWSAREKRGMDMLALHQHVPEFSDENREPHQLIAGLHNKAQAYVRFAWGLNDQPILNQHPTLQTSRDETIGEKIWLRIERQVLTPLPDTDLMLFTIRTYFRDCGALEDQQRHSLISAINSMSDETLSYKNINRADVLTRLGKY